MSDKLNSFLTDLAVNPKKLGEYQANPDAAMIKAGLDDNERAALKGGDPEKVYALLAAQNLPPPAAQQTPVEVSQSVAAGVSNGSPADSTPQVPNAFYLFPPPGALVVAFYAPQGPSHMMQAPQVWSSQAPPQVWSSQAPPQVWSSQAPPQVWSSQAPPQVWSSQAPQVQSSDAAQAASPENPTR
jgi:hypothetical protein